MLNTSRIRVKTQYNELEQVRPKPRRSSAHAGPPDAPPKAKSMILRKEWGMQRGFGAYNFRVHSTAIFMKGAEYALLAPSRRAWLEALALL